MKSNEPNQVGAIPDVNYLRKPASSNQRYWLNHYGVNYPEDITYAEASVYLTHYSRKPLVFKED